MRTPLSKPPRSASWSVVSLAVPVSNTYEPQSKTALSRERGDQC